MKKNYILFLLVTLIVWTTNAQITLTQSVNSTTVDGLGVSCNGLPTSYADNSFLRAYVLADFSVTEDFGITSVEYGQSTATDGAIITCNIYTADTDDLTIAALTLVGTADHVSLAADDASLVSVALTASIPAGSIVVFEVFAPADADDPIDFLLPGVNGSGENDDSYIMAAACGVATPVTTTSIGFPSNYVMNVKGDILSVEEFSLESSVSIFPNPTSDIITIDVADRISVNSLELYNIVGKQVIKTTNVNTLDLSQLSTGVYMLRVNTDSGTLTKKVIRN